MTNRCPNCIEPIEGHPENGCVVAALIGVLRDREDHTEEQLLQLHRDIDVDALWDVLGPVIDTLGDGGFNS